MASASVRSAVAVAALACLLVVASAGAAAHATALFGSRELAVDAGGSVDVDVVFHNADRTTVRLAGPDGFTLTGTVRNTGGGSAVTITLDTGAAARGDGRAAIRVSGGTLVGATVENAPTGGLPPGEYETSLRVRGVTVDRGTLVVRESAATGTAGTASGTDGANAADGAHTTDGTTAGGPEVGTLAAAVGGVFLALVGVAVGRRRR